MEDTKHDIYTTPMDLLSGYSLYNFYDRDRPYCKMGAELDTRPELWSKIIAFEEKIYIASTDVDDDKLELLGKAMGAGVWAHDRDELLDDTVDDIRSQCERCYDKTYLRALRDWLKKVKPETTIWTFAWRK
jgi:hypothetical protein